MYLSLMRINAAVVGLVAMETRFHSGAQRRCVTYPQGAPGPTLTKTVVFMCLVLLLSSVHFLL